MYRLLPIFCLVSVLSLGQNRPEFGPSLGANGISQPPNGLAPCGDGSHALGWTGTTFSCQFINGGGVGGFVVLAPPADQTISGAHRLTLSDAGSSFLVNGPAGIGQGSVPGGVGPISAVVVDSSTLNVERTLTTGFSNLPTAIAIGLNWNGSADKNGGEMSGLFVYSETDPASTKNVNSAINGFLGEVDHRGSGTVNLMQGGGYGAFNFGSGTITLNQGADFESGGSSGTITNDHTIEIDSPATGSTFTNPHAGIFIDDQTVGGLLANAYGIRALGNAQNDLGGGVTKVGNLNASALTASLPVCTDGSKNLTNCSALPNGTAATTQTVGDNTTKIATDAFVIANGATPANICIDARNYTATGGDFAVQINSALTAAVAVGGPHCVDARGVVTPVWMNTNPWAGISSPANVYWPMGKIYASVPIVTPATTVQGNFGQGGSPQATVMPNFAGTQFIACNSTGPEGCGTNPNSFANFTAGTTMPGHGPLTGTNTNPVWVIGGADAAQPVECFDCRLENLEIDSNLIANGVCYYTYSAEEGSTFRDSDCNNALLACAVYDRGDRSPGTGHATYVDTQCSTPKATTAGKYGVILYGGNGSGTAAGLAQFSGSTFHGTSAFPMQNDAIYIDDISSLTINQIHCEYITGYCANIGPANTTKNVQVSVNGANTLTAGLVHFGTHTDSSDNVQDVNVSGTQNIIVDDLATVTLTGSTFPKLNFWYAGQGFATTGSTISAYCTGAIGTANTTAYFLFPSNGTTQLCNGTTVSNIKMPQACLASNFQFQSRVAPTTSATFTFNKNGASQFTGTWTNGVTTFTDTTHFVLFNVNDTWSISITTGQATDGQQDIRGTFACR